MDGPHRQFLPAVARAMNSAGESTTIAFHRRPSRQKQAECRPAKGQASRAKFPTGHSLRILARQSAQLRPALVSAREENSPWQKLRQLSRAAQLQPTRCAHGSCDGQLRARALLPANPPRESIPVAASRRAPTEIFRRDPSPGKSSPCGPAPAATSAARSKSPVARAPESPQSRSPSFFLRTRAFPWPFRTAPRQTKKYRSARPPLSLPSAPATCIETYPRWCLLPSPASFSPRDSAIASGSRAPALRCRSPLSPIQNPSVSPRLL